MKKSLELGAKSLEQENAEKLEKSLLSMRAKLEKIVDIALAADAKCGTCDMIGQNWMKCSKALCEIRDICGPSLAEKAEPAADMAKEIAVERKHTMDFGRFHVTRAAIPGRTILTFRRKQEVDAEHGSVIPGRIIIAKIFKADVGNLKQTNQFVVKSYEAGEHPRVLFSGQTWVSMSKTEKMVYKMVKCNVKETQRRCIMRKRSRAAKRVAAAKGVK